MMMSVKDSNFSCDLTLTLEGDKLLADGIYSKPVQKLYNVVKNSKHDKAKLLVRFREHGSFSYNFIIFKLIDPIEKPTQEYIKNLYQDELGNGALRDCIPILLEIADHKELDNHCRLFYNDFNISRLIEAAVGYKTIFDGSDDNYKFIYYAPMISLTTSLSDAIIKDMKDYIDSKKVKET